MPERYTPTMMTIHRVSAGDGYEYYSKEVASDDERREHKQELSDYYLTTGSPAGEWEGSALREHFQLTGEVTEAQMRDLFGQGKRPDAQVIRDAKGGVVDEKKLLLGNPYGVYSSFHQQFTDAVNEAVRNHVNDNDGMEPTRREMARIRRSVARDLFIADRNREPANDNELTRFVATQTRTSAQAVAGFDLTFSAPKSVSVLWALGDRDIQKRVEAAHTAAIRDTISYLEADVIGSRAGRNGVRRVKVDGIMAARFRHYDSRAGDPQLHDHLVVSNKVFVPFGVKDKETGKEKGVWRTIDSKALYKATVSASERYNNALMTRLTAELGVIFEQRGGDGQALKMEIASVPEELVRQFSTRRAGIKDRLEELKTEYIVKHGHEPSKRTVMCLAQQATLETRQAKQHRPLPERIKEWRTNSPVRFTAAELDAQRLERERAKDTVRTPRPDRPSLWKRLTGHAPSVQPIPAVPEPVDDVTIAARVLNSLEERRSTWTRRHVQAETARQIAAANGGRECDGDRIDLIASRVLSAPETVMLSHPEQVLHNARKDQDGVSVYDHPDMWRYTSHTVIDRENWLLDAAERDLIPSVSRTTLDHVLGDQRGEIGADKLRMIEALTLSSKAIVTAVGPAGSGKTTAMRHVAQAVQAQGGSIVGLAPSAVAARELGRSLGIETMTAHKWLVSERWNLLRPGDMVLIDEAGMVDNITLSAVTNRALEAGAVVRMVGDPAQLGAVDAGGGFELLHTTTGDGIELDTVWRFKDPDEADASLALRSGPDKDAFTWYQSHDRVKAGSEQDIINDSLEAWTVDHQAGKTSIIIASTTERVAQLNDQISALRAASGETSPADTEVLTRDGHLIRLGDSVLTRYNDPSNAYGRHGFVRNGDLFTVQEVNPDGSLRVIAPDRSVVNLDPGYVADHVQLGYASTVHRSQGVTVDTAHAILDASVDRSTAYVAMTRGRARNSLWLVVEEDQSVIDVLDAIASRRGDNVSVFEAAVREAQDANDSVRMRDIYHDLDNTANRIRWSRHLDELVKHHQIPEEIGGANQSLEFPEVVRRLTELERAGVNIDAVLPDITKQFSQRADGEEGKPEDPAIELADRIDQWTEQHPTVLDPTHAGPLAHLDDEALADLAAQVADQAKAATARAQARDGAQPVDVGDPELASAWTARPYGKLTDAELAQRIKESVAEGFAHTVDSTSYVPDKQVDQTVKQLLAERDIRAAMDPAARRREDTQRWEVSHIDGTPVDMQDAINYLDTSAAAATTITHEVTEEQGRRRWRTTSAANEDGQKQQVGAGLSEWSAPSAAARDRYTPESWVTALSMQHERLDDAVTMAGRRALDEAGWAQHLRRPASIDESQWHRAVGEVATWRAANRVGDHYPLDRTADTPQTPDDARIHEVAQSLARYQQPTEQASDKPITTVGRDEQTATAARRRQATAEALRRAREALNGQRQQLQEQQRSQTIQQQPLAPRQRPGGPRL